ncbi:hypothetical protein SCUCBS95973_001668 [Sporothrix curviconia]|uniref:SET domain-containing protein n=1 Tax=Sporothrix curviconia TaxID=1260050 RepID=A0ABP0B0H6_9PEZI
MAARSVFSPNASTDKASKETEEKTSADWPPDTGSLAVPAWTEQTIPGKDVGLLAARPIRRGERIMARTPAVMVDGAAVDALPVAAVAGLLHDAASSLPRPHRAQFFNLSTNYGADGSSKDANEAYQIFATNAFRTGIADGGPDLHSVFRDVSRINHGCQPNCAYFFDPATLAHNVYAVVDIMQGEELTVGYIDPVQTHAERKAKLHRHWGFGCTCARCAQPPHRVAESDDRVRSIRSLLETLDNYTTAAGGSETGTGPAAAELLVLLFALEGLHARMHEAEYRLALEWNGAGDGLRATQAARRCLDRGLLVRGAEQAFLSSMRALVADPTTHWSWRFRLGKNDNKEQGSACTRNENGTAADMGVSERDEV